MTITAKESNYSLTDGFAYVVFKDGEHEFTIQACLMERKECEDEQKRHELVKENKPIYKKTIKSSDSGMDWGICSEVNKQGFNKYGVEKCKEIFKAELKKIGIRFL